MELYKAKVRLNGSVLNEARVENATAAEIFVLRKIHGNDAVLEIQKTGDVKRTDRAERDRLAKSYSKGEEFSGEKLVESIFGVAGLPLPQKFDDVQTEETEVDDAPVAGELPVVDRRHPQTSLADSLTG